MEEVEERVNEILKKWMNPHLIEEMEEGVINAPQDLLGMHFYEGTQMFVVRRPVAQRVWITDVSGETAFEAEELNAELGLFGLEIEKKKDQLKDYRVRIQYGEGDVVETADPYAYKTEITDYDTYLFAQGNHYEIFDKLGAHVETIDGVTGTRFAVWAPHARSVSVVGYFNMWDGRLHTMSLIGPSGIYELFVPDVGEGAVYKYQITTRSGELLFKTDPYGNYAQMRPDNASVVTSLAGYEWQDGDYEKKHRAKTREVRERAPMNIYEAHLGSWKKRVEDDDNGFYSYRELAEMMGDYLVEMGYTHIELMGIAEYPFDGSWGYQVGCYYAPTSRYGTPKDFMYFVDYLHQAGIGVILDWVPAHFPKDEHGLGRFDGTCLYEHLDKRQGEHPHWGTLIYNYGRPQVANYLIANALFWLEQYHADGLRLDAVASMLYLDYGKQDGEWIANIYGGNENLEAIEFLKKLNQKIKDRKDGSLSIAEESTAWPMVTGNIEEGGLGFDFKWNMGWMNDYLEYIKTDPLFRKGRHGMITFSMVYQYSENFMLVFSHDEVVHMKGSMYRKMPGTPAQKLAGLRQSFGYMAAHPGKKLIFMGQEFGQEREFSEKRELDWNLLDAVDGEMSDNERLRQYVSVLNSFYLAHPAMYELDARPAGFEWISTLDADHSVIAFLRKSKDETLLVVCNFTPVSYEAFRIGVPFAGKYKEIFNSDASEYGGTGFVNPRVKQSKRKHWDGRVNSIECRLAPLAIQVFTCTKVPSKAGRKKKES